MRKFLMISASVLALGAGQALADPTTTIDDSSEGSVNEITQSAVDTMASISVTQTGEGGDAPGTANAAAGVNVHINQATDEDSMITVTQDGVGDGNSVYIDQDALGGASTVMSAQAGGANQADITQAAADSSIALLQEGDENAAMFNQTGADNSATIGQAGEGNTASVDQMADENIATVEQWGEGNMASILQDGMTNTADVDQGASGAEVEENTAEVFQHGTESFVMISQLGSENKASATQDVGVSDGAVIDIIQTGTGGSTTIVQNSLP